LAGILFTLVAGEVTLRDRILLYPRFHEAVSYGPFTIRRLRPRTTFWHQGPDGRWKFTITAQGFGSDHDTTYAKPLALLG